MVHQDAGEHAWGASFYHAAVLVRPQPTITLMIVLLRWMMDYYWTLLVRIDIMIWRSWATKTPDNIWLQQPFNWGGVGICQEVLSIICLLWLDESLEAHWRVLFRCHISESSLERRQIWFSFHSQCACSDLVSNSCSNNDIFPPHCAVGGLGGPDAMINQLFTWCAESLLGVEISGQFCEPNSEIPI